MAPNRRPNPRRAASPEEAVADIKAGLSSITDRLEAVFGAAASGQAQEQSGQFEIPIGDKTVSGVFGISMRMGLDGLEAKTFGNLRPGQEGPEMADTREPLVDVFDEGDEIVVTVELPGVTDEEVSTTILGDVLRVEAIGRRRYATDVPLGVPVDPDSLQRAYQNGILEIRLTRRTG